MAFDKFKQLGELNKMRQQAKKLEKELEKEEETLEKGDNKVKVDGTQRIKYLKINGEEREDIADLINSAMKKVQKKAAKKMMEMGGGLSGLLGN
jgi:DNA-binding protein YbaB